MKKFLQNLIARKKAELADAEKKMKASSDVNEVRSLGETLLALRDEINDAEQQLAELDKDDGEGEGNGEGEGQLSNPPANGEGRSANGNTGRSTNFKPTATYGQGAAGDASRSNEPEDPRGTMEYRKAFMDFFKTGKRSAILQTRSDDQNESGDLGVLLPITIVQEIIKGVEKVYGQLYSGVKKTNIKGGVKYPIGSFEATFTRIYETAGENRKVAPTDRQNGGSITGYVEFSYKLGEIRLAQTLLANVLSVPVFEQELAKTIIEAYVKAMDGEILNGDGSQEQCEGILTEANKQSGSRIKADHIISFSADDMLDWKTWQKNLFAKIPLSMRSLSPKFVMTPNTYEANIKTLVDDNNRPVYSETYNPVDGTEIARFKGKEVTFVEEGQGIENFDDINPSGTGSKYFGIYWVPEKAYAINTNLEFAVKRYFDEEKLQYVDRAIVINDGKILDEKYIYLLKKKA